MVVINHRKMLGSFQELSETSVAEAQQARESLVLAVPSKPCHEFWKTMEGF